MDRMVSAGGYEFVFRRHFAGFFEAGENSETKAVKPSSKR